MSVSLSSESNRKPYERSHVWEGACTHRRRRPGGAGTGVRPDIYDLFGLHHRPVLESSELKSEPINLFGLRYGTKSSGMDWYVLQFIL